MRFKYDVATSWCPCFTAKKASRVRSTWSAVSGAQWRRRVMIAVRASGGPSMMCF